MVSGETTIRNFPSLHARPASILVKIASEFRCDVVITCQGKTVQAKNIMSVLAADLKYGEPLTVTCKGDDEKEALKAVLEGIAGGLGEAVS